MKNIIVEMRNSWDGFDIRREDLLIRRNSSECLTETWGQKTWQKLRGGYQSKSKICLVGISGDNKIILKSEK